MKYLLSVAIIIFSLLQASCGHKKTAGKYASRDDSLRVVNDRIYQAHLIDLRKVRETLVGPLAAGDGVVLKADKFKSYVMEDHVRALTGDYEKLNAKLEEAQKDSTTQYGALLTRFRLLDSQHKYLTATYSSDAHLLSYTSEVTFDDTHEEVRTLYFSDGVLVYFRERNTSTLEDEDLMTDDSYFLQDGVVTYSYRDEGTAEAMKNRMHIMSIKRYNLKGDLTGHVAKEFLAFKSNYEILLTQPLEAMIYPGAAAAAR